MLPSDGRVASRAKGRPPSRPSRPAHRPLHPPPHYRGMDTKRPPKIARHGHRLYGAVRFGFTPGRGAFCGPRSAKGREKLQYLQTEQVALEKNHEIRLVGHACIVADCADTSILMDPWLFGKIFNNSWSLLPEPEFNLAMLDKVDYIWISHEHPDHCHFPTLGSLPTAFKARVTILLQDRESAKIFPALRKLGYERFQPLPHRKIVPLSDKPDATRVYCYHAGLMDSALAVLSQRQVIFNANDARVSVGSCKKILDDIGHVDVLLNQFSLAAYAGFEPHEQFLPHRAKQVLENVSSVHDALGANVTIPFASFMYFSSLDNKYVNDFTIPRATPPTI